MSDSHLHLSSKAHPSKPETITTYTLDEISQQYDVSTRSLRKYIKQGRLRATRIGRCLKVTHQALLDFFGESAA